MVKGKEHGAEERVVRGKADYCCGERNVHKVFTTLQFPFLSTYESSFFLEKNVFSGFSQAC